MIINPNILTIGHQALEEDLCHTLMDIFDEQEMTEVIDVDGKGKMMTVDEDELFRMKAEDKSGRVIYSIGQDNSHYHKIMEWVDSVLPKSGDYSEVSYMQLIKYPTNSCMPFHMDAADSEDTATALFNLNDNFHGGRLIVDGHIIQPSTGQMVCFNNSTETWHGVDTILQGERYVLALWFTDPERFGKESMTEYDTNTESGSEGKSFPKVILKK